MSVIKAKGARIIRRGRARVRPSVVFGVAAICLALSSDKNPAVAQMGVGTAFTYQGELQQDGTPVDEPLEGSYHLIAPDRYEARTGYSNCGKPSINTMLSIALRANGFVRPLRFFATAPLPD